MGTPVPASRVLVTVGARSLFADRIVDMRAHVRYVNDMAVTETGKARAAYQRRYYRRRKAAALASAGLDGWQAPVTPLPDAPAVEPPTPDGIADWIETHLRVPSGPLRGRPFEVHRWQRDWLKGALRDGVREAGMSVARKNGKSGFIAGVLLAYLRKFGPPQWRGIVASLTGPLAREQRDALMATAEVSAIQGLKLLKSPPPGRIEWMGRRLDFLAADKATGHALGADLAIIDEAGLLGERQRGLWNAVYSAISGRDGQFWCISIQGEGPMFAELEARDGDPTVFWRRWAAPDGCDLDDTDAWKAANPALVGHVKSPSYMADAARRAAGSPGNEAHFRAYDLNQSVDPGRDMIVSVRDWMQCVTPDAPDPAGDIIVGLDIGGSSSMTCAVAYSPATGAICARGAFGDTPPISQRARNDGVGTIYDRMLREKTLKLYPGRVTPVTPFLTDVLAEFAGMGRVIALGADRFRRAECLQAFEAARLPAIPCYWRGQGASATADGSHDVRAFQKAVLEKRLATRGCTMLESAIASSALRYDGSGNPALEKRNTKSRIDALSAAVIAVGIGAKVPDAPLMRVSVV